MVGYLVHPRCHHPRPSGLDGGHHGQSSARGYRADDLGGAAVAVRQSRCAKGHAIHFHHRNWIRGAGSDDDSDLLQVVWTKIF